MKLVSVTGYDATGLIVAVFDEAPEGQPAELHTRRCLDDPEHEYRQFIAAWEADGNTIPPYVPSRRERYPDLSPGRFWAALRRFNYEAALLAWVAGLKPTDPASPTYISDLDYWSVISAKVEHGEVFVRDDPAIEDARVALDVASAELDGMWDWAWQ